MSEAVLQNTLIIVECAEHQFTNITMFEVSRWKIARCSVILLLPLFLMSEGLNKNTFSFFFFFANTRSK